MREIKFRGKSQIDGKWVYGVPVKTRVNCGKWYIELVKEIEYETDLEFSTNVISVEIEESTLGQFTGLYDKNSKEIYEGDIVLVSKIAKAQVFWHSEDVCFAFDYGKQGRPLCLDFTLDDSIEVIGNRWDNPELLKEKNDG